MQLPTAIFLMGPTAAGKTALALDIAKQLPVEIISVDSAMVYKGMDIGTGKPTLEERARIPHHLIDIRDPSEPYSAAEFRKDALRLMSEITKRQRIPLLVGGTMLYFRVLQEGLSLLPSADRKIRARILEEAHEKGWWVLHQRLARIDPKTADKIHPNDTQRIQRALEVYEITKKPMSECFESYSNLAFTDPKALQHYRIHTFILAPTLRVTLHQRIEQRFHYMLQQGLILEAEKLFKRKDLDLSLPAMRAVGYRQIFRFLAEDYGYEIMVDKAIAATRQLAKRQLTWLRSLSDAEWLQNNHLASLTTVIHCVS